MQYNKQKIKTFTDLVVWKESHKLVIDVYKISKKYPSSEVYGLTNQTRRCVVSITSNVAEGFSRRGKKEKIQFYYTAKGSLTELHNQLIIAKDVRYISEVDFKILVEQITKVGKLLTGLIRSANKRP